MLNNGNEFSVYKLKLRQNLPLEDKILLSNQRIFQWCMHWHERTYISFSGGKDSTVLLHLVRKQFPNIPAVFVDTGLEYPEIREFVKTIDNVIWLKPKMNFKKVIEEYGYPVISKMQAQYIENQRNKKMDNIRYRGKDYGYGEQYKISEKWKYLINAPFKISAKCCDIMKKQPLHEYTRTNNSYPYLGVMAGESSQRKKQYIQHGCNMYDSNYPQSRPIMFWTEEDIWEYIKKNNIKYASIYDNGMKRTGCMFCLFGIHLEKEPNRFDILKELHPNLFNYCMNKLNLKKILSYIGIKKYE